MKNWLFAALLCGLLASTTAGAGTLYLSFDGDDGSGSSLAGSGVAIAGGTADVTFDGSMCRLGAGDTRLDFGQLIGSGSFTAEFTVHNLEEFNRTLGWNWVFAFQVLGDGYCLYPAGVCGGDGTVAWLQEPNQAEIAIMDCGVGLGSDATAILGGTTAATIKAEVDATGNTVKVYVAYDDDATSGTARASNFTLVGTYPWGNWSTTVGSLYLQSYDAIAVVDDIIIEGGESVPDFGEAPPYAPSGDLPVASLMGLIALVGMTLAAGIRQSRS